jgi:hypothetical protein
MVSDLRELLRETADDPPTGGVDHAAVLRAGRGRVRRHRWVTAGGAAAAVAVTTVAVLLPGPARGPDERVLPAAPVRLSLDDARPVVPQLVARARTLQQPGDDIDYDRIDGVTADGLVVRARYTYEGDFSDYGLIDPATGSIDWLPRPPWDVGEPQPLDLGAERLLFLDNRHAGRHHLLVFDRTTDTWAHPRLDLSGGRDSFFGLYGQLGDDERVYFPDAGDVHRYDWSRIIARRQWWSAPVAGGTARHETELDGLSVTWSSNARATADRAGRIVVTEQGTSRTLARGVPAGCQGFPALTLAGNRVIARYECDDRRMLVVLDETGAPELSVEAGWLWVDAADSRYALLDAGTGAYVLDLERQQLLSLGKRPVVAGTAGLPTPAVSGDLVVWSALGPEDSKTVSDVVYRAVRLP